MKKLIFVLPLALSLVLFSQQEAWSQRTVTRTGPNGNSQTTIRTRTGTGQQTTTRTGSGGNSATTTRSTDGNGQQTTTRTGSGGNSATTTRTLK